VFSAMTSAVNSSTAVLEMLREHDARALDLADVAHLPWAF
jgi:hypothetical protein